MIHRRHPFFRALTLGTLAAFLGGCLTTNLPPISAVGSGFTPLADEVELWSDARAEEENLLEHVQLYDDPQLERYLDNVVAHLTPTGMAANPELQYKVRVLEDPTLNAFAYPHGNLYVHTGLLARMENEDQLATVLAHEMTHVENRHMLRYRRGVQNRQNAIFAVAIAASIWASVEEDRALSKGHWGKANEIDFIFDVVVGLGLQLALVAAVNGYGRNLEDEADQGGFVKMRNSGYELSQAPRVYEILQDGHGESSSLEVFFFGSHPNLSKRVENARLWIGNNQASSGYRDGGPIAQGTDFAQLLRPVLRDDARMNLEEGRLGIAEDELQRALALDPNDSEVHYLIALAKSARAQQAPEQEGSLRLEAKRELERAIELDASKAEYWRELGDLTYAERDYRRACQAYERFLDLDPDSEDAGSIEDTLHGLRNNEGVCP